MQDVTDEPGDPLSGGHGPPYEPSAPRLGRAVRAGHPRLTNTTNTNGTIVRSPAFTREPAGGGLVESRARPLTSPRPHQAGIALEVQELPPPAPRPTWLTTACEGAAKGVPHSRPAGASPPPASGNTFVGLSNKAPPPPGSGAEDLPESRVRLLRSPWFAFLWNRDETNSSVPGLHGKAQRPASRQAEDPRARGKAGPSCRRVNAEHRPLRRPLAISPQRSRDDTLKATGRQHVFSLTLWVKRRGGKLPQRVIGDK